MLIYANYHIFFISHLSGQIWCLYSNIIGLNAVPLCFGFGAQVAWTYVYIEYRHPEHHPNSSFYS